MSRVAIPVTHLTRDAITAPTATDSDAIRNHTLVNDGSTWLEIENTDSVSRTVDFVIRAVDGVIPLKTITLAAGAKKKWGSIPSGTYNQDGVAADQTLTSDGTAPADNDTVTIAGQVYTYKTSLSGVANQVLIGASAAIALSNLKDAINDSGGEGTTYGTGTVANSYVTATTLTSTTLLVVAQIAGTAGNSLASTESCAHLSWAAATLLGGYESGTVLFINPSVSTVLKFNAYSLA